ncbi:MAG: DUF4190 domain-containing protein [Holophagaceae bacterium]|nr:DUF4190 domain-containing protein [Holophagaceae bacterium]
MTTTPPFNSNSNPGETQGKIPAPGAKAGRVCGILAIVLALTCVGIPVAIILGIVAIVKTSRAKRLAHGNPGAYEMPTSAGLILGIVGLCLPVVMLPFAGIVSAIAIPALLGQRAQARDKVLRFQWAQVRSSAESIAVKSRTSRPRPLTGEEAISLLMADASLKAMKNARNPEDVVLINSSEPRPGTIALSPEELVGEDGKAHYSLILRAYFGTTNAPALQEEKIELGTSPTVQRATDEPTH